MRDEFLQIAVGRGWGVNVARITMEPIRYSNTLAHLRPASQTAFARRQQPIAEAVVRKTCFAKRAS